MVIAIFTLGAAIAADIPRVKHYYHRHYKHHRVKKEPIVMPKEKPIELTPLTPLTPLAPTFDNMWKERTDELE